MKNISSQNQTSSARALDNFTTFGLTLVGGRDRPGLAHENGPEILESTEYL